MSATPIELTLVHAADAAARAQALVAWLGNPTDAKTDAIRAAPDTRPALPDERQRAIVVEGASFALQIPEGVSVERLAAGCVCCVGQVPLRVALTRTLRRMDSQRPRAVLLLLAQGEHLPRLRAQVERGELGTGIVVS